MNTQCKKGIFHRISDYLQSIFLNGLLILLPITVTIALVTYTVKLVQGWLKPIHSFEPEFLQKIPYSEFIFALLVVFLVGIVFKSFFLRTFLHAFEKTFFSLPLMRQLYFGIKQIIHAFTTQDQLSFQRVVLAEFPRKGMYSVGFLISETPSMLLPTTEKKYFNVYVPTTPNPTTGFLLVMTEEEFMDVDLTRQEAMSLIISGGIIKPERYKDAEKTKTNTSKVS